MKLNFSILLTSIIFYLAPAYGEVVCSIHDGDTFRVAKKDCNKEETRSIRLWGVDSPELRQEYGRESKEFVTKLVNDREVRLDCVGKSYKRFVCRVAVIAGERSLDLGTELVGWGLAYDAVRYSGGAYTSAERFAQRMNRGVWQQPEGGVRPWEYRK